MSSDATATTAVASSNKPKFSVVRPVSQDIMDPNGPTTTGPAFPLQICRCNTKKAAQSMIHGERGNRCMDAISYLLYAPPLLPLPASLAASSSRIRRSGGLWAFWATTAAHDAFGVSPRLVVKNKLPFSLTLTLILNMSVPQKPKSKHCQGVETPAYRITHLQSHSTHRLNGR